nr:hypothetical protein [Tanacetum cinerariifolium]
MADLAFAPQHNMVAYLEKTEGNAEFHQIVDFLTSSSIHHALTVNPTIYASNVKQFWNTANSQTINDEKQIHATVDGKTVIFENLPLLRYEGALNKLTFQKALFSPQWKFLIHTILHCLSSKTTSWNEFCSNIASAVICLATNQNVNFSRFIFDIQSSDPPLSTGNTIRSGKDMMEHAIELMDPVPQTPHDSPLLGSSQAKEITSLKKRVTKLEQRQSLRILGFHPFRADIDDLVDEKVIVKDKGSGEKEGSTSETVSTAKPDFSAARPEVSTAKPKTPPITTTLFDDEDVTIADTLVKMKSQEAKEKGVAFKDTNDSARPIRSITTLQPLPTIDLKDKDLDEEVRTERERQEEASKAALAELYDEVQAQIDVDHELAVRLTHEEQEKYTVEERSKLLAEFFKRRKKQLAKEIAEAIKSKPPIKTQLKNLMMTYLKHTRRKCLKVVPNDDKAINYETLDVKSLIVDYESQVLGTMEASDLHVYKLIKLDGSYKYFSTFSRMLKVLDRQDGDLKTLMESSEDDEIWRNQQDWKLLSRKLYETFGVHTLMLDDSLVSINMFVEKMYPLTKEILEKNAVLEIGS